MCIRDRETEPEIADTPEVVERFGDSFEPRRENWPDIRGDIEFDHVSFHYLSLIHISNGLEKFSSGRACGYSSSSLRMTSAARAASIVIPPIAFVILRRRANGH